MRLNWPTIGTIQNLSTLRQQSQITSQIPSANLYSVSHKTTIQDATAAKKASGELARSPSLSKGSSRENVAFNTPLESIRLQMTTFSRDLFLKRISEHRENGRLVAEQAPVEKLSYRITRSKYNHLPVYQDKKGGGTKHITIIRRILGNPSELMIELNKEFQVKPIWNSLTNDVILPGTLRVLVEAYLQGRGF